MDDLKHRTTIPPYSFILIGASVPTAFVPDPHLRGRWMKVHPAVVLNRCELCESKPGIPCFSTRKPDGSPKYSGSEHYVRRMNIDWKHSPGTIKSAQIDMRALEIFKGEEDVPKIPDHNEVVTSMNVSTSIKKRKLIELIRAALPHEEQVKLSPPDEVSINKIFLGNTNGDDDSTVLVSWCEEELPEKEEPNAD